MASGANGSGGRFACGVIVRGGGVLGLGKSSGCGAGCPRLIVDVDDDW